MTFGMFAAAVCVLWIGLMVCLLFRRECTADYFTPILDAEVSAKHQLTLAKYRKLATEWGVPTTTVVCYRVRAGFTLKSHAPKAGPCYKKFSFLQKRHFHDEPTKDCLVFCILHLVPGSTNKTHNEQIQLLGEIRQWNEFPAHHLTSLGKVALNAGLILAHYKTTGEHVPFNNCWIRTGTYDADGGRLSLGHFDRDGLRGYHSDFSGGRVHDLGVFVLGVEELGS